MTNKRLLILGISLIAIVFVLSACQTTGQAMKVQQSFCKDADGGINYNQAGIVTYKGKDYADSCINSTALNELYCDNDAAALTAYACPSGCKDGACISAANTACVDEDWFGSIHDRLATKGDCIIGTEINTDYCKGDYIADYYCSPLLQDPKTCEYVVYSCKAYGFDGCDDGACVKDLTVNQTM